MRNALRLRFWIATAMVACGAMLAVFTLAGSDWIERVFGIDPDDYGGSLEWIIAGALLAAGVTLFALAIRAPKDSEYRVPM
jgi:hypothetical protein